MMYNDSCHVKECKSEHYRRSEPSEVPKQMVVVTDPLSLQFKSDSVQVWEVAVQIHRVVIVASDQVVVSSLQYIPKFTMDTR